LQAALSPPPPMGRGGGGEAVDGLVVSPLS